MLIIPAAAPDMETSSILAAFVVAVVMRAWDPEAHRLDSREALELSFTFHVLRAEELAYEQLLSSEEWLGEGSKRKSLISEDILNLAADNIRKNYRRKETNVRKEQFDRVTSITTWRRDRYSDTAITFTMSTQKPFGLPWSGDAPVNSSSFPRFKDLSTGRKSQPFTSAADLMMAEYSPYSQTKVNLLEAFNSDIRMLIAKRTTRASLFDIPTKSIL
ncbi:hypothetical protein COOONC_16263 [Cooperia oncophora]